VALETILRLFGVKRKVSQELTRMSKDTELDSAAKQALAVYNMAQQRRTHTSINKAGVELDAAKCYLQNMTIAQTAKWLKDHKKTAISTSAIGRFYRKLFKLRIAPSAL